MKRHAKIVIIGLGSAGLSALEEVEKITDDFILIQNGPYGTSCARSACMPTKTLIEVANAYHWRKVMAGRGVSGTEMLAIDTPAALRYVRKLRDEFTQGIIEETNLYREKIIQGQAVFLEPDVLQVGDERIKAERIIIATGSRPTCPEAWKEFSDFILTTEDIVELEELPRRMAVIGLGPSGIEYAQALCRLGIEVTGFSTSSVVARISDPEVNAAAIKTLRQEFTLVMNQPVEMKRSDRALHLRAGTSERLVDKVLLTIGRQPNIDGLGLEKIGIRTNEFGVPDFCRQTMQVGNFPIFIAGDANDDTLILHEAVDEGHIAGFNAVRVKAHCFQRRVPLTITFTDPNIAAVGKRYAEVKDNEIVIGAYDFSTQARARMSDTNKGLLRIYVEKETGLVLGAEMSAPAGEHLAHLLAVAIHQEMTVFNLLTLPFYHPAVEEGLRTALKDAAKKTSCSLGETDLLFCRSNPRAPIC